MREDNAVLVVSATCIGGFVQDHVNGTEPALHNCSPSDKEESPFSTLTVTLSANFK